MINREKIKIYEGEDRYIQWVKGTNFTGTNESVVLLMHDAESIFLSPKGDMFGNIGWKMHEVVEKIGLKDFLIFGYENAGVDRAGEYSISGVNLNNKYAGIINNSKKHSKIPGGPNYIKEGVFENLIPYMESKLNFKLEDTKKIMIGSSMGGQITTYTAVTYPKAFDAYISMSTCLHFNDDNAKRYIFSKKIDSRYYHDMGGIEFSGGTNDKEDYVQTYKEICNWLDSQNDNAKYMSIFDNSAAHSQDAWKERMPLALTWALRKGDI